MPVESYTRRLPVYLLLDCSASMTGEPIEAVRQGVKALVNELKSDPQALEAAHLSVITFDSRARQVIPLTELSQFKMPSLTPGGATSLGGALQMLRKCVEEEMLPGGPGRKGDWRPLVFILTDGVPTDADLFLEEARRIPALRLGALVACAAGADADTGYLHKLTDQVLMLNTLSAGDLARFFSWVSGAVAAHFPGHPGR